MARERCTPLLVQGVLGRSMPTPLVAIAAPHPYISKQCRCTDAPWEMHMGIRRGTTTMGHARRLAQDYWEPPLRQQHLYCCNRCLPQSSVQLPLFHSITLPILHLCQLCGECCRCAGFTLSTWEGGRRLAFDEGGMGETLSLSGIAAISQLRANPDHRTSLLAPMLPIRAKSRSW